MMAVHQAGAYGRRHLRRLAEIGATLARAGDVRRAMPRILELAGQVCPLRSAVLVVRSGEETETLAWPMATSEPVDTAGAEAHARAAHEFLAGVPTSSRIDELDRAVVLPLGIDWGPCFGVFLMQFQGGFDESDVVFAGAITDQLAVALVRARLREEEIGRQKRAEDLAAENGRLLEEVRRAVLVREEILAIASHDLQAPLRVFCIFAGRLQARLLSLGLPPDAAQDLEGLARQSRRLGASAANLLDVASLHAARVVLDLGDVDLVELVGGVVATLAQDPETSGSIVRIVAEGPVIGRWDARRLEQLVRNLVANAIKYGLGQPVEVRVSGEGDRATLTVADRGKGIGLADQERIFEKFERADSGRGIRGLGLGLYIVRHLVQMHGGTISVESEPGAGSTFRVVLPRASPA